MLGNHAALRDYVVQTLPCSEVLARGNLEAKGFEVYLPTVVEEIRTGRMREKRSTIIQPLFPGYLFVRLDVALQRWREVASARGVKRVLGRDSEHPTALRDGTLAELKARFEAGEFVRRVATYRISAGDSVTVSSGVFEGHTGVCTMSRGERIKVLLSLLSGAVEVDMPAELVALAG